MVVGIPFLAIRSVLVAGTNLWKVPVLSIGTSAAIVIPIIKQKILITHSQTFVLLAVTEAPGVLFAIRKQ